ncbi:efflux RND transporter periplasmic adaptor subunit [Treponema zioleckii]|uniref:efflux RND transporter periplasmic adaptor subunit n=1 Tax=Treponema zioleckii TaxID=331680 RepID=UPI00168AB854|nr:efflux RND transporter periplasmic adaptor subunit [Treponema zioleckii]
MSSKIAFVVVVCFVLLFLSCNEKDSDFLLETETPNVKAITVEEKLLNDELNGFGTIAYKSKNDVTVQVAGVITEFKVKEGDYVKKGDVLAVLKNIQLEIQKEQYESNLDSAKASLQLIRTELNEQILSIESRLLSIDKAKLNIKQKEQELEFQEKNYENQKILYEVGGVTDSSLNQLKINLDSLKTDIEMLKKELEILSLGLRDEDLRNNNITPSSDAKIRKQQIIELNLKSKRAEISRAESSVKAASQQLKSANKMLEELKIKAPVAGVIGQNYYENGEYIEANQKLTTLIDISTVYALMHIQEQDMVNFSKGTSVLITVPSLNQEYKSSISEISPIADSASGNFSVKAMLTNTEAVIKPGMFLKCSIQRKNPKSYPVILETCAVSVSENSAKVFAVVNGFAVEKIVKIVALKDGYMWCDNSIKAGDIIIDNPSPFLKEGQKVIFP